MRKEQVNDMAEQEKAQYAKPASQVDLEERLANDNKSDRVLSTSDTYAERQAEVEDADGRDFRVEGNETDNYVGTSPEYATYANETEAPLKSDDDDSAEAQVFKSFGENLNTEPVIASDTSDDGDEPEPDSDTVAEQSKASGVTASQPTSAQTGKAQKKTTSSTS